uniref:Serine/threonine-protein phosphatase 2A regulatory subunit B'' subunit beta n=1 Tax=Bactrocera latifrons TaxID=174628 RepID=A0A0K8VWI5_BACLA
MQAAPPNAATKPKTASITTTTKPTIITHPVKTKPYIDSHLYQSTLQQQQQKTIGSPIGSGKTSVVLSDDPTREIEEISKKISEHADALYHTWKSRGLAPTELLGFYTHAAAAAATGDGASDAGDLFAVDDEQTAEGLQKLVKTFVLKDKEQRAGKAHTNTSSAVGRLGSGVVSAGVIGIGGVGGLVGAGSVDTIKESNVDVNMVGKLKQTTTSTTKRSVTSPKSPTTTSAILMKSADAPGADVVDTLKKKTTKSNGKTVGATSSSAATSSVTSKSALAQKHEKQQHATSSGSGAATSTKSRGTSSVSNPTANTTTIGRSKPHVSNSAPLDINLTVDLNLDLSDLSELQTHNLRKIKELLQENTPTTTTTTQTAKAATNNGTKQSRKTNTANTTSTTDADAARHSATHHSRRGELTPKSNHVDSGGGGKGEVMAVSNGGGGSVNKAAITIVGNGGVAAVDGVVAVAASVNVDKNSGTSGAGASSSGDKGGGAAIITATNSKRSTAAAAKVNNSKLTPADNQSNHSAISVSGHKQSSKESGEKSTITTTSATPSTRIATVSGSSGNKSIKAPTIKEDNKNDSNNNTNTHTTNHLSSGASQHRSGSKSSAKKDTRTANSNGTGAATAGSTIAGATAENGMAAMPAAASGASTTTPSKFVKSGRTLTNGQDKYVGRPILTRGSVAERVLMFEKCPDVRNSFLNIKRPDPADAPPKSLLKVKLHSTPPPPPEHNSIQREIRNTKTAYIPRFYFPHGKPQPQIALERTLRGILAAFDSFPNNQVTKDELPRILKICGLPFYWRMPVMVFCQQGNSGLVERQRFVEFWKQMNVYCHDAASRFVYILSRGQRFRQYILPEDLAPLVQDVVDTHPGLAFLKEATEFHSRYVHTVIARIFYSVNRCWSGRINISELKKSDLLEVLKLLEEEDDINQIMAFFSYEHFYVIYCKFWELDKDHDLLINQDDLARHSDHALSTRIVERIFSGCVTRGDNKKQPEDEPKMSYTDFVWFLLSEEDKRTPTAIEYWFRCMDIDGDGVLSMYELEYFYEEQQQRMESIGIETLPFEDCLCQMLDMIKPARRDCVTLGDLKRCKMTHVFFDTFFNLEKYLDHEQRDPFASQRDEYSSDWDRFAAQEYELLISEENE